MPKPDKLAKAKELMNLVNEGLTKSDFVASFKNVIDYIKRFEASLTQDFSALRDTLLGVGKKVEAEASAKLAEVDSKVEARLAEIKDGENGYTPVKGVDYFDGDPGTNGNDADPADEAALVAKIEADLPSLGAATRDGLELLEGDERLKATALSGLDEEIKKLAASFNTGTSTGWGAHPLTIKGLGLTIDKNTRVIDFRGAGLTSVTRSRDGVVTVTVGGGSGTLTPIALTGTIDDSNVTFTAASQPTFLVINGSIYQGIGGNITWTYLAGTITVSAPVGTSGSIYGL